MLRHTFVTTMLDAGVDLREVQIAARRADPRSTMRYVLPDAEAVRGVGDRDQRPTCRSALPQLRGRVEAIAVAEHATGPMRHVDQAHARAGRGLDGDRYAAKAGTFTAAYDTARGYDLTLIEADLTRLRKTHRPRRCAGG
jgi:hypothetical protein